MSSLKGFATGPGAGLTTDDTTLKASRDSTNGALSVFEITVTEGPPLHAHDHEHESFYVLEGELSVICGDDHFEVRTGSFVFMPRGRAHRFWSTNGSARVLLIAVPGGIEDYFQELHAAQETERGAVQAKYGIHPVGEAR
jgi:mannose-6-phosphate isomerase-like protein (cupin superfamily)